MCGRFTETKVDPGLIAGRFGVAAAAIPTETLGRFNICPTEAVLAVDSEREPRALRWGLVPPWARTLGAGYEPINARVETVLSKRPFAPLVADAATRCLVIADGWYEWLRPERKGGARIPFRYTVDDGEPFAFAGLWHSRRVGGETVASVCLLTTSANAVCAPVHDRMPVVLGSADAEAAWIAPELDGDGALACLEPLAAARTTVAPANPAVNKAGVEGPSLLDAPSADQAPNAAAQLQLDA